MAPKVDPNASPDSANLARLIYLRTIASKGGKKRGKAKRRSVDHYRRMSKLGTLARWGK